MNHSKHNLVVQNTTSMKPKAAKENDYNEVEGGIQCKKCNSILSSESNFYKHRRTVHATNKKTKRKKMHKCLVCSKEFEKKSKLM